MIAVLFFCLYLAFRFAPLRETKTSGTYIRKYHQSY